MSITGEMSRPVVVSLQLRLLAVLLAGLTVACASSGAVPRPFPRPGDDGRAAAEPSPFRDAIVQRALSLRGVPYRNGGTDPNGFDCSGFVSYVFGQQGIAVPRTVAEQFDLGTAVDQNQLAPGDLIFFTTVAAGPSHVGIAVSADTFVHAPSSAGVVRVEQLRAPYWSARFIGVRRF